MSEDLPDSVLGQVWLEEQVALYQTLADDARRPTPVEFAARAVLPEASPAGYDLRTKLVQRLRILDGLRQALGGQHVEESFRPGDIFDDLEILEPIGKGGMGRIFRARQISVDRIVALKTPHWAASLDPREKARFWREAQAIAKLRHPGIVPLFAVGERGGTPFLVLEHVVGRPLSQIIQDLRNGSLPRTGTTLGRPSVSFEHGVAEVGLEILSALQAAHEAGVVHRDVKPGNVMLEETGRARVLDFGLAKLQRVEELTRSQELVGTIDFIAPECLENPRNASPGSDVYSVGALLYELLSLERPFGDLPMQVLVSRVMAGDPVPLRARCRVSKTMSAIVARAMDRDPARRYPSAREFANDLEALLRGDQVAARTSAWWNRVPARVRKHLQPGPVLVAVVTFAILAFSWQVLERMDHVEDRVVQAEARFDQRTDPLALHDPLRKALLWEYADLPSPRGRWPAGVGLRRAEELLEASIQTDPGVLLPRTHLHLAVLRAEAGDAEDAKALLERVEAAGWEYETSDWILAHLDSLADGEAQSRIHPPVERTPESLGNDVDRFYLVRGRAAELEAGVLQEVARSLEEHPIYGPAVLFLESASGAADAPLDHEAAITRLQAAQAKVPDHPVVIARLMQETCEEWRERDMRGPDVARLVEPLLDSAAVLAKGTQAHAGFWGAYGELLGLIGDRDGAKAAFLRAIESWPDEPAFRDQKVQTCLDGMQREAALGEKVPEELADQAFDLVEKGIADDPRAPENLSHLAALRELTLGGKYEQRLLDLERRTERPRADD